jgi:hypothetical protein
MTAAAMQMLEKKQGDVSDAARPRSETRRGAGGRPSTSTAFDHLRARSPSEGIDLSRVVRSCDGVRRVRRDGRRSLKAHRPFTASRSLKDTGSGNSSHQPRKLNL